MKMLTRSEDARAGVHPSPERGAPPSPAAHAGRKNLAARGQVQTPSAEAEEPCEQGYGHGV